MDLPSGCLSESPLQPGPLVIPSTDPYNTHWPVTSCAEVEPSRAPEQAAGRCKLPGPCTATIHHPFHPPLTKPAPACTYCTYRTYLHPSNPRPSICTQKCTGRGNPPHTHTPTPCSTDTYVPHTIQNRRRDLNDNDPIDPSFVRSCLLPLKRRSCRHPPRRLLVVVESCVASFFLPPSSPPGLPIATGTAMVRLR